MNTDEDAFWAALRRAITEAEAAAAAELAAAEEFLAGLDEEAAEPMDEGRVEALVHAVQARAEAGQGMGGDAAAASGSAVGMAADARQRVQPAATDAGGGSRTPAGWSGGAGGGVRRLLAACMGLLLAHKALAAAAIVVVAAASAYVLQHTTQTLSFTGAIGVLLDDQASTANRSAAQGTVYLDIVDAIEVVRELMADEDPGLAAQAQTLRQQLRDQLVAPPMVPLPVASGSPTQLGDLALDPDLDVADRSEALQQLGELMVYGIAALQCVHDVAGEPVLLRRGGAALQQLGLRLE
ncbi:MAG: hypothetical protein KF830_03820 [Planctomycetes bacterium]|nr:hypothetical protein [Planctomycetota bacterium]